MNILIMSWRGPKHPHAGGAEIVTHEHAKAWVKAGHKVTLFTSSFAGYTPQATLDGVEIIQMGGQVLGVKLWALIWYHFLNKEKFDLVIDHFHGLPFFTPIYVKAKKIAFIHEVTKEVWKLNAWKKPFNLFPAILGPLFEPFIFKNLYKGIPFMAVSNSTKKDLSHWEISKDKVYVINNGVNIIKTFKKIKKEDKKTIIFLGALAYDKGIEDAIKVFSILNSTNSNFQFWVVGKGTSEFINYLKKMAKKLKVESKIKFWGFVSDDKKFELLSRAHILLNPSVREGWGLVNIEANSVGTLVVGYKVPGLVDSVKNGKTGILITQGDVNKLAESIIKLLDDKKLYTKFSQNCLKWSKQFDWKEKTKESLKLIEELTKDK